MPPPPRAFVRQVSRDVLNVLPASAHNVTTDLAEAVQKNWILLGISIVVVVVVSAFLLCTGIIGMYMMSNVLSGLEFDEGSGDWVAATCTINSKVSQCCCCDGDNSQMLCTMYDGTPAVFGNALEPQAEGRKLLSTKEDLFSIPCIWDGHRSVMTVTYALNGTQIQTTASRYASWGWQHQDVEQAWSGSVAVGAAMPCWVDPQESGHVKLDQDAYPTSFEFVFLPLIVSILFSVLLCGCCTTSFVGFASYSRHREYEDIDALPEKDEEAAADDDD